MNKTIYAFILSNCLIIALTVTALAQPGSLDPTFGSGGIVTTDFGTDNDYGSSLALQSDGKIIMAGYSGGYYDYNFALARYNSDGTLDTTFDFDGKVITDFQGSQDYGYSVAIQSDGKIVVAGFNNTGLYYNDYVFALARYNPDGALDPAFGSNGKITTDFDAHNDVGYSVAIQSDGKIVVSGIKGSGYYYDPPQYALARYNTNGTLDSTFASDGTLTTSFDTEGDYSSSVAIQSDGKIVAAGYSNNGSIYYPSLDFSLARYNSDGTLDTSFSTDGKVITAIGSDDDAGLSVAIQSDGKIVLVGYNKSGTYYDPVYEFALVRYNPDGSLDNTFDSDGIVTTVIGAGSIAHSVAIQSDGEIVVVGISDGKFVVVRYDSDGSLDSTFDTDGIVTTAIGSSSRANSVAIQNDGKIVAAGGSVGDFAIVRYNVGYPVGVAENNAGENTITVSPNPFTTEFVVSGTAAKGELMLFDIFGKELLRQSHSSGTQSKINTENLLPGFYLLKYNNGNKTVNIKVIKL